MIIIFCECGTDVVIDIGNPIVFKLKEPQELGESIMQCPNCKRLYKFKLTIEKGD